MRHPLLFILFLLVFFGKSQTFNFNYYSVDKGLSQSEVQCLKEDSRGYIWAGTKGGGVCRFDGEEFISYEERDGLAGQQVTCIEEDAMGNMWFGTPWSGVSRFDGKNISNFDQKSGLLSNSITCMMNVQGEQMLIGTNSGLILIEGKTIQNIRNTAVDSILINFMVRDADGSILIVTDRSVVRYVNGKFEKVFELKEMGTILPSCIGRDKKNKFWMGTFGKGI
ncbi:MAG: hypothetical protein IAF38_20865, partial [Bacteroidia bacterium]|nr:hypothetical protein [Bacteroidia bacterium]